MNNHCFAAVNSECTATISENCDGCKFYKTVSQQSIELAKCERRLRRIGLWERYKEKYGLLGRHINGREGSNDDKRAGI